MWRMRLYLELKNINQPFRPLFGYELIAFDANSYAAKIRYIINRWSMKLTDNEYQHFSDVELLALFEASCAKSLKYKNRLHRSNKIV